MNSSSGSSTITSLSNSQQLSSKSSLSPSRKGSTEISKLYKHASHLFLTRRLNEALQAINPIVNPTNEQQSGYADNESRLSNAAIATATTSQRVKIWNLYITILSSIIDLGVEEGKREIGQKEFQAISKKVRDGEIWEQVVQNGYGGREGSVDAEVVYNLATLLLGQAPNQHITQSRLETYFSSSVYPDLNIPRLSTPAQSRRHSLTNGASTPKDLSSRLKILELFTLHVLPRNEEWDYARAFISGSDILDDERRELFLQTLQEIQDLQANEVRAEELEQLREDELQRQRELESRRADGESAEKKPIGKSPNSHRRAGSEVDYGIAASLASKDTTSEKAVSSKEASSSTRTTASSPAAIRRNRPPQRSQPRQAKSLLDQARNVLYLLQKLIVSTVGSLSGNPATLVKSLVFLASVMLLFGRQEIRERTRRILRDGWQKVIQTGKMGGKVSYI
ncbi:MAG: hypothetical protein Q9160_003704 [Pyrenula sp. 1 TL-2023]